MRQIPLRLEQFGGQTEQDERQQESISVPRQQQRQARLNQQLPKTPFLDEHSHPVKCQHNGEQAGGNFVGNHIGIKEQIIGGKGQ